MKLSARPREITPHPRVRALMHLMRTPLSAALLRLRLSALDQDRPAALADLEGALLGFDTAVATLLPLAGGALPTLQPVPGDLVPLVVEAARAGATSGSLHAPTTLPGLWDGFAVACIVRNLLSLATVTSRRPVKVLAMTLSRAARGASLSLLASAAAPPPGDARPWLIERLAQAHGGHASFSFEPNRLSAQVSLAGYQGDRL